MASRNHQIGITHGGSGFFAVHTAEFNDLEGRPEVWYTDVIQTGIGRYRTSEEALEEAKQWSESDEIPLEPSIAKRCVV